MPDMGAGITLYEQAEAVDTLSFSPLVPNAALVRRIIVGNPTADDTWVVRTNGQEVARFRIRTDQVASTLPSLAKAQGANVDVFEYCKQVLGFDLIYPVPEGKTITIASVGGATAKLAFEYEEFASSALNPSLMNYPGGGYFVAPAYGSRAAAVAAAGEAQLDTEVSLDFVPPVFLRNSFPVGWTARILDLFAMGAGVNTYSGTADHTSNTRYLAATKSGQRLFTRSALGGIPVVGRAASAGSANINPTTHANAAPPIEFKAAGDAPNLDAPILYRPGYVYEWAYGIDGDVTGGGDYSSITQLAIVEYRSA